MQTILTKKTAVFDYYRCSADDKGLRPGGHIRALLRQQTTILSLLALARHIDLCHSRIQPAEFDDSPWHDICMYYSTDRPNLENTMMHARQMIVDAYRQMVRDMRDMGLPVSLYDRRQILAMAYMAARGKGFSTTKGE